MARGREAAFQVFIALLLIMPALALGAVHYKVLACCLALSSALAVLIIASKSSVGVRLDLPGAILACLAAFTLIQLIPLPAAVVKILSPAAFEVRQGALGPLNLEAQSFMPLTLDASLTVAELGKLLVYLSVYWACSLWARRHGSRYIINIVVATGVAAAAVFLAHRILLLDKVYGFYTPIHRLLGPSRISAPLINENHMAGLLGICAAAAIGRALAERERTKRALLIALAALVGGSLALTLSRGGIAAFISGQCLFVLLRVIHRFTRQQNEKSRQNLAWLPLGLALSLGLGLFVAQDLLIGEFASGDTKKLELALEGLPLIGEFWTVGVGRGAFWVAFPLVSDLASKTTFTHAENAVIQLLADWGALIGGLAIAGMAVAVGGLLKNSPRKVESAAALVAIVVFGLHNLVDFNLEVLGVAVLVVALLAAVSADRAKRPAGPNVPRWTLASLAAFSVSAALALGVWASDKTVDAEEIRYRKALAKKDPKPFSKESLFEVLSRHPADWYFPYVAGVHEFYTGSRNPLPWFARAIELNPVSAPAHFYVGRSFLKAGRLSQAMLELRLAASYNPAFTRPVAELLVSFKPDFKALSKIAFEPKDKLKFWGVLADVLSVRGKEEQAEAADEAVLKLNPLEPRSLTRQARRLVDRGDGEAAMALAGKLAKNPGHGPAGAELQAQIYSKLGQAAEAVDILEKELAVSKSHPGLLRAIAWARQRSGDHRGAVQAAKRLKAAASSASTRASACVLMAELSLAEGGTQAALAYYREAYAIDSSNLSVLKKIADLAQRQGDKHRAAEALRKLLSADPSDESVRRRLEALEEGERRRGLMRP